MNLTPYSPGFAEAIRKRDISKVREFIESTPNPRLLVADTTYLATAIDWEAPELVLLLIETGADVNGWIDGENTMLMAAAYVGSLEIAQILVEAGADVNLINPQDESAIHIAACNGNLEVFNYLAPLSEESLRLTAEAELEEGIRLKQQAGESQ